MIFEVVITPAHSTCAMAWLWPSSTTHKFIWTQHTSHITDPTYEYNESYGLLARMRTTNKQSMSSEKHSLSWDADSRTAGQEIPPSPTLWCGTRMFILTFERYSKRAHSRARWIQPTLVQHWSDCMLLGRWWGKAGRGGKLRMLHEPFLSVSNQSAVIKAMDVLRTKRANVFETSIRLPGCWGEPSSDHALPSVAGYSVSELSQQDTWSLNMALHTDLGSSRLPSKMINAFLTATMRPTCSDHLTLNSTKKVKVQNLPPKSQTSQNWQTSGTRQETT